MKPAVLQNPSVMSIGKLAKATGASIDIIRFYEKAGLLPKPARTASGYRKYSREDELRLAFVARARALGFSLDEIGEILQLRAALQALVSACPGSGEPEHCPILNAFSGGGRG